MRRSITLALVTTLAAGALTLIGAGTAGAACTIGANPSGVPITTTAYPGGRTVFTDDFDRCDLGTHWGAYSGQPGGNPNSTWSPSMVTLSGNALHLSSSKASGSWITGGVSNWPISIMYGRWDVRLRVSASADTSYHILLWPANEQWPPEIDFGESVDTARTSLTSTLHYKDANGVRQQQQVSTSVDMTQWHTISVEWRPTALSAFVDGVPYATITDPSIIPATPMWLGMQVEGGACDRKAQWGLAPCPSPYPTTPTTLDVDWVRVTGAA